MSYDVRQKQSITVSVRTELSSARENRLDLCFQVADTIFAFRDQDLEVMEKSAIG